MTIAAIAPTTMPTIMPMLVLLPPPLGAGACVGARANRDGTRLALVRGLSAVTGATAGLSIGALAGVAAVADGLVPTYMSVTALVDRPAIADIRRPWKLAFVHAVQRSICSSVCNTGR